MVQQMDSKEKKGSLFLCGVCECAKNKMPPSFFVSGMGWNGMRCSAVQRINSHADKSINQFINQLNEKLIRSSLRFREMREGGSMRLNRSVCIQGNYSIRLCCSVLKVG